MWVYYSLVATGHLYHMRLGGAKQKRFLIRFAFQLLQFSSGATYQPEGHHAVVTFSMGHHEFSKVLTELLRINVRPPQ